MRLNTVGTVAVAGPNASADTFASAVAHADAISHPGSDADTESCARTSSDTCAHAAAGADIHTHRDCP